MTEVNTGRRCEGETGAALVEFAFVFGILALFLSGIITFGLILASKQTITQAASEGARAAVTSPYTESDLANPSTSRPVKEALAQAERSLGWLKRTCASDSDAMTCTATLFKCQLDPSNPSSPMRDCISVEVLFNYKNDPVIPVMPFIDNALPQRISATAVVALEGEGPLAS
jgi:Flp pilus assembly protein TadG